MRRLRRLRPETLVLFCDWTILRRYPPLRQAWAWWGRQAVVPISGTNAKRVLFWATALGSGHRVLLRRTRAGQGDFHALLRALRRRYPWPDGSWRYARVAILAG